MPKYVKWDTKKKKQNEYNIGNSKFSFGKQGISSIDIIIIVIASIAIIASGFFLIKNIAIQSDVSAEIDILKSTIENKHQTITKLAELGDNEQTLKLQVAKNELYIPNKKNSENIMSDVDEIIDSMGAAFISIKYGAEAPLDNGVIDLPFVLKIRGTYDQINNILKAFNQMDRLYIIDSNNSITTDDNSELVNSELLIHAYYKP